MTPFLSRSEFQEKIANCETTQVVVFAADWCGYCKRFLELAGSLDLPGELSIVDIDDENESLWDEYKIQLVPTLLVFRKGKEVFRQNGRPGAGLLRGDLDRAFAAASAK